MKDTGARPNFPALVFFGVMVISLGGLLLLPRIPQDQSYHQFVDQRTIFGIPNFWNVVSNFAFPAVGAAGLREISRQLGNRRVLFRRVPDRDQFFLLSLGFERRYLVLGPFAE